MKKPNLSKIGKWMKDNKCFIIGTIGVFVAEAGFLAQGVKEGYQAGAEGIRWCRRSHSTKDRHAVISLFSGGKICMATGK